jgi:DNA repair photolyase
MTLRWKTVAEEPGDPALFSPIELGRRRVGTGEFAGLEFFEVNARRVLNRVPPTSAMPFEYTINAYRGCSHACTYCFARPTHRYLDLGAGEDFDRKIVVKINAVERVRAELARPSWDGSPVALGTNTDPYQRCEGKYGLTQGIIEALAASGTPFSILTKSTLILRDLSLLQRCAARVPVRVNLSIPTLDPEVWRITEPGTPHPLRRIEAVARLNAAGISTGVLMAPILPGLSDTTAQLRAVVEAALGAGAVSIGASLLYLRGETRDHYLTELSRIDPLRAASTDALFGARSTLPEHRAHALSQQIRRLVTDVRLRTVPRSGRGDVDAHAGATGESDPPRIVDAHEDLTARVAAFQGYDRAQPRRDALRAGKRSGDQSDRAGERGAPGSSARVRMTPPQPAAASAGADQLALL